MIEIKLFTFLFDNNKKYVTYLFLAGYLKK
jgi:hypothetical protein